MSVRPPAAPIRASNPLQSNHIHAMRTKTADTHATVTSAAFTLTISAAAMKLSSGPYVPPLAPGLGARTLFPPPFGLGSAGVRLVVGLTDVVSLGLDEPPV